MRRNSRTPTISRQTSAHGRISKPVTNQVARATVADSHWLAEWKETLDAPYPGNTLAMKATAGRGQVSLGDDLREAHGTALNGVLAPHATRLDAFRRAYDDLQAPVDRIR